MHVYWMLRKWEGFSLCCVLDLVCVMCGIQLVLCAVSGLCYVWVLVRVTWSLSSVLCAIVSLFYMRFMSCVSYLVSLARQLKRLVASLLIPADRYTEMYKYKHIYIYIYIYYMYISMFARRIQSVVETRSKRCHYTNTNMNGHHHSLQVQSNLQ